MGVDVCPHTDDVVRDQATVAALERLGFRHSLRDGSFRHWKLTLRTLVGFDLDEEIYGTDFEPEDVRRWIDAADARYGDLDDEEKRMLEWFRVCAAYGAGVTVC